MTGWEPDDCHEKSKFTEAQIVFALTDGNGRIAMKIRKAKDCDYDWIKIMSQRHKKELGYLPYAAIREAIKNGEVLVADVHAGFCIWHKRRDGWYVIYDIVSEVKGAGRALLFAVPTPRRLKAPVDLKANGFYERMGGHLAQIENGKKRDLNVWVWAKENSLKIS